MGFDYIKKSKPMDENQMVVLVAVEKSAGNTPVAVATTFGRALRNFHFDSVLSCWDVAEVDVFGIGDCGWAPVGAAEVG